MVTPPTLQISSSLADLEEWAVLVVDNGQFAVSNLARRNRLANDELFLRII